MKHTRRRRMNGRGLAPTPRKRLAPVDPFVAQSAPPEPFDGYGDHLGGASQGEAYDPGGYGGHALDPARPRLRRNDAAPKVRRRRVRAPEGTPPEFPFPCDDELVGQKVSGKDFAGRVIGCATPPEGKRGRRLWVGGSVVSRARVARAAGEGARARTQLAERWSAPDHEPPARVAARASRGPRKAPEGPPVAPPLPEPPPFYQPPAPTVPPLPPGFSWPSSTQVRGLLPAPSPLADLAELEAPPAPPPPRAAPAALATGDVTFEEEPKSASGRRNLIAKLKVADGHRRVLELQEVAPKSGRFSIFRPRETLSLFDVDFALPDAKEVAARLLTTATVTLSGAVKFDTTPFTSAEWLTVPPRQAAKASRAKVRVPGAALWGDPSVKCCAKAHVPREHVAWALRTLAPLTDPKLWKGPLKLTSHTLLSTVEGGLSVSMLAPMAGNDYLLASLAMPAAVKLQGAAVVPTKALREAASGSGSLSIDVTPEGTTYLDKVAHAATVVDLEFFATRLRHPDLQVSATVQASELARVLHRVEYARGLDETRPHLMCVHLASDGKVLRAEASDGHRAAVAVAPVGGSAFDVLVPSLAVDQLLAMLARVVEPSAAVTLRTGPGTSTAKNPARWVEFTFPGGLLRTPAVDVAFPNLSAVIPETYSRWAMMARLDLLEAVEVIRNAGTRSDRAEVIELFFEPTDLSLTGRVGARRVKAMVIVVERGAKEGGWPFLLGVNATYLAELLAALEDEAVTLEMNGPLDPIRVRGGDLSLGIVMPARIGPKSRRTNPPPTLDLFAAPRARPTWRRPR